MNNKNNHTDGTAPKSNRQITETGKIDKQPEHTYT